ncbi:sulfite exporter TauE/SafE family protein [Iamia sp. SCSIO 61187]|uniref:sulfite exporter TauE/SafE family protein n=1 Tax=Iamia sp. SCSIO 61187 TaxID=2722752 RepID=UPI001C636006|nr:sulfite exporter TauE/SafE family protein [Iamia sp. SCSIO 61187]QYG93179.1 sulfite exporter TauE/SafE family protein [Iamia sp. SCSIO 61187]
MDLRGLLASPLGFLIGLSLGALGGGGSILAVPALVYAAGQSPRAATTTSLLLVGIASIVGLRPHLRAGRVRVATGLAFGAAGIPGSLLGSAVNQRLDPDLLLLGFAGLVLVAAWRMLTGCPTCTKLGEDLATGAADAGGGVALASRRDVATRVDVGRVLAIVAAGTAVGFLTGLFGVGGGFVIVPALTLLLRMNMPTAIGTSLLVIGVNSAVGLAARISTSSIEWGVTLPFAVAAIAGVLTGGRLAGRLDPERSLRWFAGLLVAVALYTAADVVLG